MKKYGFIFEALVAVAMLEGINQWLVHAPVGLVGVSPHPYWLVVIFLAARYGGAAGFCAGALCGAILLGGMFLAMGQSSAVFRSPDNFLTNFWQPLLMVVVGFLLGEIRSRQDHRLRYAQQTQHDAEDRAETMEESLGAVLKSKEELQRRIVGQVETVSTLYAAAKQLDSLDTDALYPAILDLLTRYLGATGCSVYLLDGNRLVRKEHRSVKGGEPPPTECTLETSVMGQAIQQRSAVSVPELMIQGDFDQFQGDALMAAPIFDLDHAPIGVIGVSKIGFSDFNPSTRNLFDMIADWANTAIRNALYYHQTADKNIHDDELGLLNYNYFTQRIEEEFADAQRHELPLSLMIVRFVTADDFPRDRYIQFIQSLSHALGASLRKVDLVTKYRTDRTVAILVRTKKVDDVSVLADRLRDEITGLAEKIQRRAGDIEVTLGVASIDTEMKAADELVTHAEVAAGIAPNGDEG